MRMTFIEKAAQAEIRRIERLTNWHRYFAWLPTWVAEGDCRWLEWIERKGDCLPSYEGDLWRWTVRALNPSPSKDNMT